MRSWYNSNVLQANYSIIANSYQKIIVTRIAFYRIKDYKYNCKYKFINKYKFDFYNLQEFTCCLLFFFACSVREREENLYRATTNKLIHGGPRVHDGKYRHWSHVLL